LSEAAEQIAVSERLKARIDSVIAERETKEESPMKRLFTLKRVAFAAVALCLVIPTAAFALGHINSYVTVSDKASAYSKLPTASELTHDVGFAPKAVESFANGYRFKAAYVNNTKGLDESGNTVEKFKQIDYTYVSANGQNVSLCISKPPVSEEDTKGGNAQVTAYKGIELTYLEQTYRFVPSDYQMSAQDKAESDSGAVVFSYGSDEVTDTTFKFLTWSDQGIHYSLMANDTNLSQADFVSMAKEIINQ
jgi:hypothetical protein